MENKMKEVAELLGIKLEEEFIIEELAKYLSGMPNSILNTNPFIFSAN